MPLCLGSCTPSGLSGLSNRLWPLTVSLSKHPFPIATVPPGVEQSYVFLFLFWIQPSVFVSIVNSSWERMQMSQQMTLCGRGQSKTTFPGGRPFYLTIVPKRNGDKREKKVGGRCTKRQKVTFCILNGFCLFKDISHPELPVFLIHPTV